MASIHDTPSESLINAAIASLIGATGTAIATASAALTFGPLALTMAPLFYSSMLSAVTPDGTIVPRRVPQKPFKIDREWFAPEFNHDFTKVDDRGKTFTRGKYPYERPCGSCRIALNVKDKFGNDNSWLGMKGAEQNEWPVSYHGTAENNALSIAQQGYKLSMGKRFLYGEGIYSTPEVAVARGFAEPFEHKGDSYECILQNRVNPKYLKVIPKSENDVGTYWLSAADCDDVDESELIRPYGICLFKLN